MFSLIDGCQYETVTINLVIPVVCTTQEPDWLYSPLFALENTVNYNKNNKHK